MNFRTIIVSFFLFGFLAGCGGSSGDSSSGTLRFQTGDFAGKSIYLVDGSEPPTYELAVFNADGTGMTSDAHQSGVPVAYAPFTWVVENGKLKITDDGLVITIALLDDDIANRYYKVQASALGQSFEGGMFYDQATGLIQAQQFVTSMGASPTNTPSAGGGINTPTAGCEDPCS